MGVIVHCKLPNASENISGVPFKRHPEGHMATDEVDAEVAAKFEGINGYEIVDAKPSDAVERQAILAEASQLGVKIDGRLSTDKLRAALDAEKAKRDEADKDQA